MKLAPTLKLNNQDPNPHPDQLQILEATEAKPARIAATLLNRVPGATVTAYASKGVVYVSVPGALVPGPFAVPRKKTVLRSGTAVRIAMLSNRCPTVDSIHVYASATLAGRRETGLLLSAQPAWLRTRHAAHA